jgi:glycosyltransferase involved in cell wall biosynthesis
VDLVALSSVHEGSSNVILEAMAASRPVVATTVGGNAELIAHGATGWLVPPRDPAALGQAVIRTLNDPALARGMGQAARRRVEEFFTIERTVIDTEALYTDLLKKVTVTSQSGKSDSHFAIGPK